MRQPISTSFAITSLIASAAALSPVRPPMVGRLDSPSFEDRSVKPECLSIKDVPACSPFGEGYYINSTAIKELYGLDGTPTAQDWSDLITTLAYGGELLKTTLKTYAACDGPNYDGDTLQFMRTNLCLNDIFTVSASCNPTTPPKYLICEDACDGYKKATTSLISDEHACPKHEELKNWSEIQEERKSILEQATVCSKVVSSWKSQISDLDKRCFVGVDDDVKSCGLGGNIEEAENYCKLYPTATCCFGYSKAKGNGYKGADLPKSIPSGLVSQSKPSAGKKHPTYPECLPIDETSACAPWAQGYYINSTAIGLQYGLSPLTDVQEWDEAISLLTAGGDLLKQVLGDYTGCTGYAGEPIQFLKTYVCLIDIFDFSDKCNKAVNLIPPSKPLCTSTCNAYGASVSSLIEDKEACPNLSKELNSTTWEYLQKTRADVANGGKYCASGVASWQTSAQGCVEAVDSDLYSCGFAGNLEVAQKFCDDVASKGKTVECCKNVKPVPGVTQRKSVFASAFGSSSTNERDVKETAEDAKEKTESFVKRNTVAVIIGSVCVAAVILFLIISCCISRSHRRHARNNRVATAAGYYNSPGQSPMMKGKEAAPFAASNRSFGAAGGVGGNAARLSGRTRIVGHPYTPQLSDEVELKLDDVVEVLAEYDDGWGKGQNMRTKAVGTFPLACLRS
ncbi:hypothetical protein HDU97_006674 [Phlyctochytrium planicorne]|nr:hypothetical protein HDU97_006674 [Phlyctochytrium planicorne]